MSLKNFSSMDLLLIITTFFWGVNSVIMKIGFRTVPIFTFNAIRIIMGALMCWLLLYITKSNKKLDHKDISKIVIVSVIGFAPMLLLFTIGLNFTTAGNAVLIAALVPVSVTIINHIMKIEKLSTQGKLGIIVSFTGIIFIVLGSGNKINVSGTHLIGIVILLMAQLSCAIYTVFTKDLIKKYSILQMFSYMTTISAIIYSVLALTEINSINILDFTATSWMTMFYSGVIASCLGHFVWTWGVQKMGSNRTSIYNNLVPVFGVLAGCIVLDENFGLIQAFGAVVIITGVYLTKTSKKTVNRVEYPY